MKHPYRPPVGCVPPKHIDDKGLQEFAKVNAQLQAASDKRNEGIEFEIVDSVLPSGGKGFKCQFYYQNVPVDDMTRAT